MLDIDFLRGNSEKLKEIKVQEGFFYLTTDTGKLYTGLNNNLCYLGDIITVSTKADLPPSSNYFYYIEEDDSFWKYNNKWVQLNSGIKEIKTELSDEGILRSYRNPPFPPAPVSETAPAPAGGLPVSLQTHPYRLHSG